MAPTDSSSAAFTKGNFELVYSLKAGNDIPVNKYKSSKTGLNIVISEVGGPVVYGFFVLATESFDDDGLPHTLEHLIFLGSEDYPYKGVLDMLANRCLASGTNAWTDTDHTCYTVKTAGSDGFLALLPIYVDHILYPTLTDSGFMTEVYHVTKEGKDAGVVYCEEQATNYTPESIAHYEVLDKAYPGVCGFKANIGGACKNLRESTTNEKVRAFHKEFYRPENLTLIICGQVKAEDVFKSLEAFEKKVESKGPRGPFIRPWQRPVEPLTESYDVEKLYASDREDNGLVYVGIRGPSVVKDLYRFRALNLLFKYLTDTSASPLAKAFVEIEDPYASDVSYASFENSDSLLMITFESVPLNKLNLIKDKLKTVLETIASDREPYKFNMSRMLTVIRRKKLECLSSFESAPHKTIAYMAIGDALYGNTKQDFAQRLNEIDDLSRMEQEESGYWLKLMQDYLVDSARVVVRARPSCSEQKRLEAEDEARVRDRVNTLGDDGLAKNDERLMNAIDENETPPPSSMLTSVPVPSVDSISFHSIKSYTSDSAEQHPEFDLTQAPVYMHADHVLSNFVYMSAMLDCSGLSKSDRLYLPLVFELLSESGVVRDGACVPHEQVQLELENDTVSLASHVGFESATRFECGPYSHTAFLSLQVEPEKYVRGIQWLRELLYQLVISEERISIIAQKLINDASQVKRNGNLLVKELMKGLVYNDSSNHYAVSVLRQDAFLNSIVKRLATADGASAVKKEIESVLKTITNPDNVVIHVACDLDKLAAKVKDPISHWKQLFIEGVKPTKNKLKVIAEWEMWRGKTGDGEGEEDGSCVVGVGAVKSAFYCHTVSAITDFNDPNLAPLLVFLQYLTQLEGPLWRKLRGQGLTYSYNMLPRPNEGLLYLTFYRATDVIRSYKEAAIVLKELLDETDSKWEKAMFEAAKASLIFEIIDREATVADVISQSQLSYFKKVNSEYNRKLVNQISKVNLNDMGAIGKKYIEALLTPSKTNVTIVTDPGNLKEIKESFEGFGKPLKVYETLEKSYLNNL
ncbi:hypothetical protein LSTR_LSTR004014 [Laodelphax striatellus]|uniref:Presequence protease, mitochondrial n=1 Tax=Laodelphax striatellus TaxID=195883 RepID=A0A482WG40_LAOST|nr:hypothetical protein LSTR_LSTR004014 [Laodelphax striatellus]